MSSKYRYDDEPETRRPSLLGLLKVLQPYLLHRLRNTKANSRPSEHCPKTLPHSPLQTRPTRLSHNSPHLHHRPLPPSDRVDSLHALLLELRAAHRLCKRHTPTMGRPVPTHAISRARDITV